MDLLVSPVELDAMLRDRDDVVVLDVRWRLDQPDGRPAFRDGHVPGAVYVDLETELAAPADPALGRHPLPTRKALQDAARGWGLRDGDAVVVLDDLGGMSAARAWWLLRHAGVADVRLLDGGWSAWAAAGLPVETGATTPERGDVTLDWGRMPTLELDEVAAFAADHPLLDARAAERYRGEVEPIDPRAGHIPGAISAPTADSLDVDRRLLSPWALRIRFGELGARVGEPVGVYCGSGVTAAHEALALAVAGFEPVLYPGSWSQWSAREALPVATGPTPSGR